MSNYGYAGQHFATNDAEITTIHIYGVRYPDGTIQWDGNGTNIYGMAATSDTHLQHWVAGLEDKARKLHIDPETYSNGHKLVRRTIVIAATAAEEI